MSTLFVNPVISDDQGRDHGDPFVLEYAGTYYLYHTGGRGVSLYTSTNLVDWQNEGVVLTASADPAHWAQTDFWAPEVFYHNGVFYMYVAATKKQADGRGDDQARRQGIARANNPRGPFIWDRKPLVDSEWSIDGHPYQDANSDLWFFYNIRTDASRYHDGTVGCGNVVDRLLAPDRLEGQQAKVTYPSVRWEGNKQGTWYWNEGACVLKRRGIYFQMYSGGFFADDTYGIGFATASAPRGPWSKYAGNPIFRSAGAILGPGHHCVVQGPDGVTPYVVYHGYIPGQRGRKVYIDRLHWTGDGPCIAGPTDTEQMMPPGPAYDPAVPFWRLAAWVQGDQVTVAGFRVLLPSGNWHYVEATQGRQSFTVHVDRVLVLDTTTANMQEQPPQFVAKAVQAARLTTWCEDEEICSVAGGNNKQWSWGGTEPVEVVVAVKGQAVVIAGEARAQVDSEKYQLVRLLAPTGMESASIQAGEAGVTVSDMTLTTRPRE